MTQHNDEDPRSPAPSHDGLVNIVSVVETGSAGTSILACRIAVALNDAGHTAQAWVPWMERHPDTVSARRFSSLRHLLNQLSRTRALLVGLHPDQALAQKQVDHLSHNDLWELLWERPGRHGIGEVARDLQGVEHLRHVATLNSLFLTEISFIATGAHVRVLPPVLPSQCFSAFNIQQGSSGAFAIALGRLSPTKGIVHLAELWASSMGLGQGIELLVATSTPSDLRVDSPYVRAIRLGSLTDRIEMLRNAKVAIFPAISDHLPQALLEAMAVGTPVIATSIPGHTEVVRHGETGMLVDAGLANLAATIKDLSVVRLPMILQNAHDLTRNAYSSDSFITAWCAKPEAK
jgi:glycosyltransferase involved in cell wall biosynthesis